MLKKILFGILIAILLIILIPLIIGIANNAEIYELNDETRSGLYGEFVELSDGWVHYELKGPKDAQSVVLIHGNSSPYFSFDNNVDALLNAGFRVLRYDIYGHGFSDRPKTDFDHLLYDRQLIELLDVLKIEKPVDIVGTSQGGTIGVYFAAHHPERIRKLALFAPLMDEVTGMKSMNIVTAPVIGDYFKIAFFDKMNLKSCANVFSSTEKLNGFKEKYKLQMQFKGWKRAKLSNMRSLVLEDIVHSYKIVGEQEHSVLLIWGTDDRLIPEDSINRMRSVIPGIEYHKIERVGHIAHYERPEDVNPLLLDFLSR
jgi:pimeloyl-ACP methyl ester carboxylesterase